MTGWTTEAIIRADGEAAFLLMRRCCACDLVEQEPGGIIESRQ